MIQFNLLPDVKLQFIKAQRTKQLVIGISIIVAGAALGLLVLMYMAVAVFQKNHINDLTEDIKKGTSKLQSTKDLDKILTVQNQLNSLTCTQDELQAGQKPCLHDKKPVASRLFAYLPQLTPNTLNISNLDVDFSSNTINITGSADALSTVNKFVDTLKFTKFTYKDHPEQQPAFSSVVLSSFSVGTGDTKGVAYQLAANFDAGIFDASKDEVALVVPKQTTTRSELAKPTEIFNKSENSGTQ